MKWLAIGVLKIYKAVISPIKGKSCRYCPSCSVYAMEAYRAHGFFAGTALTLKRLLRCNPRCAGGFDPVPLNLKGEIKWSI